MCSRALKVMLDVLRNARLVRLAVGVACTSLLLSNLMAQTRLPALDSTVAERTRQAARHAPPLGPVGPLLRAEPRITVLAHPLDDHLNEMGSLVGPSWLGPVRSLPIEANAAIGSDAAPLRLGRWQQTGQGLNVWRTTIRSTGASAVRIHFEGFDVDGRVYVYPHGARAGTPFVGPYERLGPQGDGDFWSGIVFSDIVTIEYVLGRNSELPDEVPFRVNEIAHILSGALPTQAKPTDGSLSPIPVGEPRAIVGCHLDVSCYPDWQRRDYPSQALLVFTSSVGSGSCSGTLINTRYDSENTLLLLTAAHCIGDNETAQNTIFYWNYQTDQCYGQPNVFDLKFTEGAQLVVAKGPDMYDDFSLLKLDAQKVWAVTGTTMQGWDPNRIPLGTEVVNVSHPDGAFKRIAFGETVNANWRGLSTVGFNSVRWRRGTTESGSSGSAILRESDGAFIGVFAGGNNEPPCGSGHRGYFNRFDRIYDEIEEYLESESSLSDLPSNKVTISLGNSGETVTLIRSATSGFTLNGSPFPSGTVLEASNGNKYRINFDKNGDWNAVFLAEAINVVLNSGIDEVKLMRAENRSYWIDDQQVYNGSTIAHDDRGTYRLSLKPDGSWSAQPILSPPQGGGRGFFIETVAGTGSYGFRGDHGQAVAARMANPFDVAVADSGEIFVADTENHRIRKITPSGSIMTVAGIGRPGISGDGRAATRARLSSPKGLALDSAGQLYIADSGNHRIRVIDTGGIITTFAGTGRSGFGGDDGLPTEARLSRPSDVALDPFGNVYIADTGNHRIRKVSNAVITTVAGSSRVGFDGDGGPAHLAVLSSPEGIAVDMFGTIFVADTRNHRVRRVDLDGSITTVMGTGHPGPSGDNGLATSASLNSPKGVAVDWRGGVYVADSGNHMVRRINPSGFAENTAGIGVAGNAGDGGPADQARLNSPAGLWVDLKSEVYIADTKSRRIRHLRADWDVVPPHLAPVSVLVPLGNSGNIARLWRSGTEYTYSGAPFELGDFVWGSDGLRYQLTSKPSGMLQAVHSPPNYSELLEAVRDPAEQGDTDAQSLLGSLYYFGDGVTQDFGEALKWFRLAAAQGDSYAQLFLGYMHQWGRAVDIDLPQAADWYRRAAAQGRTTAQYRLALLFRFGDGVSRNLGTARRLFLLAANRDNPSAQVSLGWMYHDAIGVTEDFAEAARWFLLAAEQGNPRGQSALGFVYYYGRGVTRNYYESAAWFRRAADQGLAWAQSWLGSLYENGKGVPMNLSESINWYRQAAVQGHAFSQWQLGQAYAIGPDALRNDVIAYVWLSLAVENGEDEASGELTALRRRMRQSQIREADTLKARCSSTAYSDCP